MAVIVFVGFLIWSYIGFFTYFQYEKSEIRKEVKTRLKKSVPDEKLIHFIFTEEESKKLVWMKKNEFRFKGKMYDVVHSKSIKANRVEYACVSDVQETKLFAKLDYFVRRDVKEHQRLPIKSLKVLYQQPLEIPDFPTWRAALFLAEQKETFFSITENIHHGFAQEILRPPVFI